MGNPKSLKRPFIISTFNRASPLDGIVQFAFRAGFRPFIFDMGSSYPPMVNLLSELEDNGIRVFRPGNIGPRALWNLPEFLELVDNTDGFFLTDGDIDFTGVPTSSIERAVWLANKYPGMRKVGFALRLDDLPDSDLGRTILSQEGSYWNPRLALESDVYLAPVDTTPAFYRKAAVDSGFWPALRIAGSCTVRHLPWYEDSSSLTDEQTYYRELQRTDISSGGGRFLRIEEVSKLRVIQLAPLICATLRTSPNLGSYLFRWLLDIHDRIRSRNGLRSP